jgi:hydrogenase nickel incorporation protein HypA/HybF
MHELSIALSILEFATDEAERQGGGAVTAVHLRLGPLSGVVEEALRSAYDLAREGTSLGQARLVIEEVPLVIYCSVCSAERTLSTALQLGCPACGTLTPNVVRGRELEIVALEIET